MYRILLFFFSLLLLAGCQQLLPTEQSKNETPKLTKDTLLEGPIKFLVLGVDYREDDAGRADGIMVVEYSADKKSLKIISIMRDSYVKIPGYEHEFNKINHAYYIGGEKLLKETIQENFHLAIDHTITVDFQGFVNIVDTIVPDGITVDLKQDLIDDMKLNRVAGINTLHGEELLKYVRFRHDAYSDFGRVERQQDILLQLVDEMKNKVNSITDFVRVPRITEEIIRHVNTDLSMNDMLVLLSSVYSTPIETIETMKIPIQDGFTNNRYPHAGEVLELDFQKNLEVIDSFFDFSTPVNK